MIDQLGKLKYAMNGVYSGGTPTAGTEAFYSQEGVPFVTIGDMSRESPVRATTRRVSEAGIQDKNLRVVPSGTVLVSMYATIGLPNVLATQATISQAILALFPRKTVHPRFLLYWLHHSRSFLVSDAAGSTQGNLNAEKVKNMGFRFTDWNTQERTADFLDRETARIDQLIEKKERQRTLLDEQHRAFISHATTCGLNHGAARQRTAYSWVPEIPAHWTVARLKFVASRIVDCLHETPEYSEDGEYLSIRTSDLGRGFVDVSNAKRVEKDQYLRRIQRLEPEEGDVLFTREGERYGLAALVPPNTKLCLGQRIMMFRANDRVRPAYLMWSLNGSFTYQYLSQSTAGATSPHLNIFDIRNAPIFLPPLPEQAHIVDAIDERFDTKQRIVEKVHATVERMREYRSALISAAVTGQIHIEDWRKRGDTERQLDAMEEEVGA